jgi:hypothetical protein
MAVADLERSDEEDDLDFASCTKGTGNQWQEIYSEKSLPVAQQ